MCKQLRFAKSPWLSLTFSQQLNAVICYHSSVCLTVCETPCSVVRRWSAAAVDGSCCHGNYLCLGCVSYCTVGESCLHAVPQLWDYWTNTHTHTYRDSVLETHMAALVFPLDIVDIVLKLVLLKYGDLCQPVVGNEQNGSRPMKSEVQHVMHENKGTIQYASSARLFYFYEMCDVWFLFPYPHLS